MKSFISEDKTVLKAIEKAIALAENPSSFTIKVLDSGVQSIFWWQNKAAIILFTYELEMDQSIESKKVLKKQGPQFTKKNFKNQGISEREGTSFLENRCNQKSTNPLSFNHKEKKIIKGEGESRSNPFQENDSREMKMGTQTPLLENLIQGKQVEEKDKKLLQEKKVVQTSQLQQISTQQIPVLSHHQEEKKKTKDKMLKKQHGESELSVEVKSIDINEQSQIKNQRTVESAVRSTQKVKSKEQHQVQISHWTPEQVIFVNAFLEKLNEENLFSSYPLKTFLEDTLLVVLIQELNEVPGIEKKHLFSSLVVMIYEHLKTEFSDFESKNYRLIVR